MSRAQATPQHQQPQQPAQTTPPPQQPDQAAPEAGGPGADTGVIALPKKKEAPEEAPPPAPAAPKVKNPEGMPNYSLRVEVPEVTVDVGVLLEKTGQFVPNLKPGNFRVYEDGVEQKVTGFKRVEAPITALLLCEFAATNYYFIYDMRNAACCLCAAVAPPGLRGHDDLRHAHPDRHRLHPGQAPDLPGHQLAAHPRFSERNLFDALYEAEDRLSRIEGRKYIILIASGRDTFSKLTFDKILQKVKATPDVTIFTVSTGGGMRAMTEGRGGMRGQMRDMDYLQADNEMRPLPRSPAA